MDIHSVRQFVTPPSPPKSTKTKMYITSYLSIIYMGCLNSIMRYHLEFTRKWLLICFHRQMNYHVSFTNTQAPLGHLQTNYHVLFTNTQAPLGQCDLAQLIRSICIHSDVLFSFMWDLHNQQFCFKFESSNKPTYSCIIYAHTRSVVYIPHQQPDILNWGIHHVAGRWACPS